MRHYHGMGSGWDMETELDGFEIDGINTETGHSLMLVDKFDRLKLQEFIKRSGEAGFKPFLIFHPQVFRGFQCLEFRLRHPRKSDNTWVFFFNHAYSGHKRTASCWLDIGLDIAPGFDLPQGVYNMFYSAEAHGVIQINPVCRPRR
ncbi:hypothetical protein BVH01_08755 [Pseudomonas sp. PA1(2017)]|nr:hypothetical protein BVH01_08755 [Pseudomonas sp. PA1(2017)]